MKIASAAYGCFSVIMPLAFPTGLQMSSQHLSLAGVWERQCAICCCLN